MKKAQSEGYLLIIVVYLFFVAKSEGETMLKKFKKFGIVNENDIMVYLEGLADNNHLVEKNKLFEALSVHYGTMVYTSGGKATNRL